jgi:hypothetical protein
VCKVSEAASRSKWTPTETIITKAVRSSASTFGKCRGALVEVYVNIESSNSEVQVTDKDSAVQVIKLALSDKTKNTLFQTAVHKFSTTTWTSEVGKLMVTGILLTLSERKFNTLHTLRASATPLSWDSKTQLRDPNHSVAFRRPAHTRATPCYICSELLFLVELLPRQHNLRLLS